MDERRLSALVAAVLADPRAVDRFESAHPGSGDPADRIRSLLPISQESREREALRLAVYRPGADENALDRLRSADAVADRLESDLRAALAGTGAPPVDPSRVAGPVRRRRVEAVLAAVAVVAVVGAAVALAVTPPGADHGDPTVAGDRLARGAISTPILLAWDRGVVRSAVASVLEGKGELGAAVAAPAVAGGLTGRPGFDLSATGVTRTTLSLDRFGEIVRPTSMIGVLVACERGRFRLTLSTVTQGRSQTVVVPLATRSGSCGRGVHVIRYRPIRGLLPTTATLEVPAGSRGAVEVTLAG